MLNNIIYIVFLFYLHVYLKQILLLFKGMIEIETSMMQKINQYLCKHRRHVYA